MVTYMVVDLVVVQELNALVEMAASWGERAFLEHNQTKPLSDLHAQKELLRNPSVPNLVLELSNVNRSLHDPLLDKGRTRKEAVQCAFSTNCLTRTTVQASPIVTI